MADSVIQLKCSCNNYPWGKVGHDSLAARLCAATPGTDFKISDDTEYAEMWFGTYPDTPSYVLSSGENLQDVLHANKEKLIGSTVLSKFGADLPFLPKILSIAKALPLQIHPDKDLASRLHEKDGEKFTDANHKPEIAVALSQFELFVGFKPLHDIQTLMQLPPLKQFLPAAANQHFNDETLKQICKTMLEAPEDTVVKVQEQLGKISKSTYGPTHSYILDLLPQLQKQYSKEDNGTLIALVTMNFLILQPGEAIYVPANGIHAYLRGDIVECMARSNNVINTGFCPRADRDSVPLFTEALTFQQHDPKEPVLKREKSEKSASGRTSVFKPPMSEFNMLITELGAGDKETVRAVNGPSVLIVTSGSGKMRVGADVQELQEGWIFFIGQGVEVKYDTTDGMTVYRAYAE